MDSQELFWIKANRRDDDLCWEWQGQRTAKGYGRLRFGANERGYKKAHRVAWELSRGPIPEGFGVLHRCDNPACCNPVHLFLGTAMDNHDDMVRKKRSNWQRNGKSYVITEARLRPDQLERLDEVAKTSRRHRSQVMRDAIDLYLRLALESA